MPALATIILAAGKGERMRSQLPKVLHPIAGDPLLTYPVEAARGLGANPLVCVLGHGIEEVKAALGQDSRVKIVHQKTQNGTADAVTCAQSALRSFRGEVLILYGDVPFIGERTLREFLQYHRRGGFTMSLLTALFDNPTGYGRIIRDPEGKVVRIVEEPDLASEEEREISEINSGIYLLDKEQLFKSLRSIARNKRKGEYYLTDLVDVFATAGKSVGGLCVSDPIEVMGINTRAQLALANHIARERINHAWMERGVTLQDPNTTYIDRSVTLESNVVIGPGCVLRGQTLVKKGTTIDAGSVLEDMRIDADVTILPYCVLESSHMEAESHIGPFAHLRPNSRVGRGARIGNFVELKNTSLRKGAKANHLSYLGDADIGAETNVGAGTITCNYDGFAKHKTIIGPRSFIGSDTQFVAPVKLGSGSWVGAGSTITDNVPAGAIVLSRVDQVVRKGWA